MANDFVSAQRKKQQRNLPGYQFISSGSKSGGNLLSAAIERASQRASAERENTLRDIAQQAARSTVFTGGRTATERENNLRDIAQQAASRRQANTQDNRNRRVTHSTNTSSRNPRAGGAENIGNSNYIGMALEQTASGAATATQNIANKFLNDTENRNIGLDSELHRTVGLQAAAEERKAIEEERSKAREEAGEPTAATNRRMTHREDEARVQAAADEAVKEAKSKIELPDADKFVSFADDYAERVAEKYREEIEAAPLVANVARGIGVMIPTIAANFIAPGSGYYTTFANAAQGATEEALENGVSEDRALLYGTAVGGIEVLIGKAFDGMAGALGKGAMDDVIENAAKSVFENNTTAQGAFVYLANALGEGFEEFATEYADALANRLLVGTDERKFGELTEDALYSGLVGALVSGVIQGGQLAAGSIPTAQELADATVEQMENAEGVDAVRSPSRTGQVNSEAAESKIASAESEILSEETESRFNPLAEVVSRRAENKNAAPEGGVESTSVNDDPAVHTAEEQAQKKQKDLPQAPDVQAPGITSETLSADLPSAVSTITQPSTSVNPLAQTVMNGMDARRADESVGAAPGGFDPVSRWQMEAETTHDVNEEAARVTLENRGRVAFDMPTRDIYGQQTSKHASTLINANITTNEMASALQDAARRGVFSYIPETNAKAAERARSKIEYDGWEAAYGEYKNDILSGRTSADIVALGVELYNNAANAGNLLDAMDIASLMVQGSTNTAQALQAISMVNKASPEMQLYMKVRSIENIRDQIMRKYGDRAPNLNIDDNLLTDYRDALVSGDKKAQRKTWNALAQSVADQVPSTFSDKLAAWRYLAMLGNPRTHVRNIEGNVAMFAVRTIKDIVATGIESGVSLVSGGKIDRTKSFVNLLSANDRALFKVANDFFSEDKAAVQGGGKYNDAIGEIEQMKTVFRRNVPLEYLRKGNSFLLDVEDIAFSYPAYMTALAGYMKANGITADAYQNGEVDESAISKARAYAVKEASKATFRDSNLFSEWASKLGRNNQSKNPVAKAANIAVEAVFPFKKTPANILVRGVEYSPVGILSGTVNAFRAIKSDKITAAEAIDQIAAGLTGTALLGLGVFLARAGKLIGGRDRDEEQQAFNELQGYQNYALVVDGKTYTVDNLSPSAMPLFMGVELNKALEEKGLKPKEVWAVIGKIADPVLEMSLLSGLQDFFDSVSYIQSGESSLGAAISSLAINYMSQYIPTLGGQIERTFLETEREQTYRYGESEFFNPTGQYNIGKVLNKIPIPGAEYNQIPYIDAWGRREDSGSTYERFVQNFINPHYVSEITTTAVDTELQRLYDEGWKVFPERAAQSTKIDGEYMSADEFVTYAETKGQTSYNLVKEFMDSSLYEYLDDESRSDIISEIYSYAGDKAKRAVADDGYESQWDDFVDDEKSIAPIKAARQAVNSFIDSGYTDSDGVDSIYAWYKTLPIEEKENLIELVAGLEKLINCMNAGMSAQEYGEAKAYHDELNKDESLKPAQRATEFAAWADRNLGTKEATAAKENLTFSSGFVVGADKYEEMRNIGLSSSASEAVFDSVSNLEPEEGYSSVRDIQQYEAIANTKGLSESDKLAAIQAYAGEDSKTYEHYEAAFECGVSMSDFVDVLRSIEDIQRRLGKNVGAPTVGELYLALANSNLTQRQKQYIYNEYATNRAQPWKTSYSGAYYEAVSVSNAIRNKKG